MTSPVKDKCTSVKLHEFNYNIETYFDDNLVEIPVDANEMSNAAECLKAEFLKTDNPECAGLAGTLHRILGNLELAEQLLQAAVKSCEESCNLRGAVRNRIRLAHVLQCLRRYNESDKIFELAIESCMQNGELEGLADYAYQHYGKSLFDQGKYEQAFRMFARAKELRMLKGDPSLIESSEFALRMAERRMG